MSARRVVVVGAITLALTILALTTPPDTIVRFIDLDLTIVVLFRIVAPLLFVGFLLEVFANWGERLYDGHWGKRIADFARGLAPIFEFMVPAEILYVILFVAFAVGVPNGWAIFQLLFSPGLILLPFAFNWRVLPDAVKNTYGLVVALYRRLEELRFRSRVIRPPKPPPPQWKQALVGAIRWVWLAIALTLSGLVTNSMWQTKVVTATSVLTLAAELLPIVLITFIVFYAAYRYRVPPSP